MKKKDVVIGMAVKLSPRATLWNGDTALPEALDAPVLYVESKGLDDASGDYRLSTSPTETILVGAYNCKYFEPVKEKKMTDRERIEQLEKELAELKKSMNKRKDKTWPDSFEEAMALGSYWGILYNGERHIIFPNTGAAGEFVGRAFDGRFCTMTSRGSDMEKFWDGTYVSHRGYSIHQFSSAKELFQWMVDE